MSSSSDSSRKLPLKRALLYILLSVVLVSGSCGMLLMYYKHMRNKQRMDPAYHVVAIVQRTPTHEHFKTVYLAELLELSVDRPRNLYQFSVRSAEEKLLSSPVIKGVSVSRILPGTVVIDYVPRRPCAFLADYFNAAIDEERVVFPFNPFFTPKRLPEIYLGERAKGIKWGEKMESEELELAFSLLALVSHYCCDSTSFVSRVDLSHLHAPSYAKREIVLVIEERLPKVMEGKSFIWANTHSLRLSPDNYRQQLANYITLRTYLREHERPVMEGGSRLSIDLRLPELAFITRE